MKTTQLIAEQNIHNKVDKEDIIEQHILDTNAGKQQS
jgi:hypothetical protein